MSSRVIFFQINLNLQSHYIKVLTVTSTEFTAPVLPNHGVTVLGLAKLVFKFVCTPEGAGENMPSEIR